MKNTYVYTQRKTTKGTVVFESEDSPARTIYVMKLTPESKLTKLFVTFSDEEALDDSVRT